MPSDDFRSMLQYFLVEGVSPSVYRFFAASSCARIAALALRLPPSFGPLGLSSTLPPPPPLLPPAVCDGPFFFRLLRDCKASMNSDLNSSASRSSAAWSPVGWGCSAGSS